MDPNTQERNDFGFSFVQLIVTMVISGILLGTVGFAAFSYIGQARDTVLESNIRTAAEAIQNTLALNPNLRSAEDGAGAPVLAAGKPSAALISELSNAAGFTWIPASEDADADGQGWVFDEGDSDEVVHIQMLRKDADAAEATRIGAPATHAADVDVSPEVRWLVDNRDAVRLQIRNEEGSWACALVVLRPDWNATMATSSTAPDDTDIATVEGNLRGIWYDAGSNIPTDNGLHHCSPATVVARDFVTTNTDIGDGEFDAPEDFGNAGADDDGSPLTHDPLPDNGSTWNIPDDDSGTGPGPDRTFERSVPDFEAA